MGKSKVSPQKGVSPNSRKALDMLVRAKVFNILTDPFVATLSMTLKYIETDQIPTAATDGLKLLYNPDFIVSLTQKGVEYVLAHEVWHVALLHPFRLGGLDRVRANKAADYAVNEILEKQGKDHQMKAPYLPLINKSYYGMSMEEIYNLIPPDPNEDGQFISLGEISEAMDDTGKGKTLSEGQLKAIEEQVKQDIAKAILTAKAAGKTPGGMERWCEEFTDPKVPWEDKLKKWMVTTGRGEGWTWKTPSRRYVPAGIYLPSSRGKRVGEVCVVVDTSGSVGEGDLKKFGAEVSSMIEDAGATALVIYVDTRVQGIERFGRDDLPLKLKLIGGGGTDFRPAFEWLAERDIKPVSLIYFTDLECHSFPEDPGYPVMWVVDRGNEMEVPFGEVVVIDG